VSSLSELHRLSIVSKVTTELENHVGVSDKDLAEFVLALATRVRQSNGTAAQFHATLLSNGAEFAESFTTNLFNIIERMEAAAPGASDASKKRKASSGAGGSSSSGALAPTSELTIATATAATKAVLAERYPGLAIPNRAPVSAAVLFGDEPATADTRSARSASVLAAPPSSSAAAAAAAATAGSADETSYRPNQPSDAAPVLYKVYRGQVGKIAEFGAFVTLEGVVGSPTGLVHRDSLCTRDNEPCGGGTQAKDVVVRGQVVFVKVLAATSSRISLSMREADQRNGRDRDPGRAARAVAHAISQQASDATAALGGGRARRDWAKELGIYVPPDETIEKSKGRARKRLTSPERWEARQLQASGAVPAQELPGYDDDTGVLPADDAVEEDVDIELNEAAPAFLAGQTMHHVHLSPVKIVKNPDGTLQRAAMTQSALAKERRELHQAQSAMLDSAPKDLNRPWEDPMPEPGERHIAAELRGIGAAPGDELPAWKQAAVGRNIRYGQVSRGSIKEQRESLPVFKLKPELTKAIAENQILVVIGETGSGKTTQMTQYLAEMGFGQRGRIGCTQPRRVAAMSVAKRVADEFGCRCGQEVGYSIRFDDCTSSDTIIKYMTDGMMLRELLVDQQLKQYSVVILDEAHERSINTDVLMGLLKQTVTSRRDLKLIVTSATLDASKFSAYFNNSPIFTIPGRTYPVDILYTKTPETDYLDASLITVMQIHLSEPAGDILLFLTGQEEIDQACQILFERMKSLGPLVPELICLPIYSALPSEMQTRIFEPAPPGARKLVIGTNIAETSVTIDGIYYVVDPGMVKIKVFNSKLGLDSLVIAPISQAQARQRAGRAGRTGPGRCYRLYTEAAFKNEMVETTVPEIQRTNLANTVLQLKAMGINDLLSFDFMDAPPVHTMIAAMESLYALGALDDEGLLTRLGRKMAEFPMEPPLSKCLLTSVALGCSDEVLTIVAMISVQNIFYRPKDKQAQADAKKNKFHQPEGDHLTLLAVYQAWKASGFSKPWCHENFIQQRAMSRAMDVRKQLITLMDRHQMDVVSCGKNLNRVRQCIVAGFFFHAARKDPQEGYRTMIEGTPVFIHPSSACYQKSPDWVIYHELVQTTKEYMREVTVIEPSW
jgi:ATP-dependent RNA helicase DHX8/PRP22